MSKTTRGDDWDMHVCAICGDPLQDIDAAHCESCAEADTEELEPVPSTRYIVVNEHELSICAHAPTKLDTIERARVLSIEGSEMYSVYRLPRDLASPGKAGKQLTNEGLEDPPIVVYWGGNRYERQEDVASTDKPSGKDDTKTDETARRKGRFLRYLRQCPNVADACRRAGIPRSLVYVWKRKDEEFKTAWEDAELEAVGALERSAYMRATVGVLEPVYYQGEKKGHIRRPSDMLAKHLLGSYDSRHRHSAETVVIQRLGERTNEIMRIIGKVLRQELKGTEVDHKAVEMAIAEAMREAADE